MNEIQFFNHAEFGTIRTMQDEKGEPWFVGADIANMLGYTNPRRPFATMWRRRTRRGTIRSSSTELLRYSSTKAVSMPSSSRRSCPRHASSSIGSPVKCSPPYASRVATWWHDPTRATRRFLHGLCRLCTPPSNERRSRLPACNPAQSMPTGCLILCRASPPHNWPRAWV